MHNEKIKPLKDSGVQNGGVVDCEKSSGFHGARHQLYSYRCMSDGALPNGERASYLLDTHGVFSTPHLTPHRELATRTSD